MAEIIRYVDIGAVGTGTGIGVDDDPTNDSNYTNAYTSLGNWCSGEASDLVTDGNNHTVYVRRSTGGEDTSTGLYYLSSWTTSTSNTITVIAAPSDYATKEGLDETKYVLTRTNQDLRGNITIEGIQFKQTMSSSNKTQLNLLGAADSITTIKNCYFKAYHTGTTNLNRAIHVASVTSDLREIYINNCIFEDWRNTDDDVTYYYNYGITLAVATPTASIYCYNNIFDNCSRATDGNFTIKNSAFIDCDLNTSVTDDLNLYYCATLTGTGNNPIIPLNSDWVYEFPDYATSDFTLVSTGNLYEGGIGPNLDTDCPTEDMEGDTISGDTCSIGVDTILAIPVSTLFDYADMEDGFTGWFDLLTYPTMRCFTQVGCWHGSITGTDATLSQLGNAGSDRFIVFVDGVQSLPAMTDGEITLFSSETDEEHIVTIMPTPSSTITFNHFTIDATDMLTVTGGSPSVKNLPGHMNTDPTFAGVSTFPMYSAFTSNVTPTFNRSSAYAQETGSVCFDATCDTIRVLSETTTFKYSVDGGDYVTVTPAETDYYETTKYARVATIATGLDGTTSHRYRIWGDEGETNGIQAVFPVLDGVGVSLDEMLSKPKTSVLIGSSVVAGAGATQGASDGFLFAKDLDWVGSLYGVSGNTTAESLAEIPTVMASLGAIDYGVLGFSSNDSGDPSADYLACINALLTAGCTKIACRAQFPYSLTRSDQLQAVVETLDNPNVTWYDTVDWDTTTLIDTTDGLHPTAAGYLTMAALEVVVFTDSFGENYYLTGTTYDSSGNILTDCDVEVFKKGTSSYTYIGTTTSDSTTGEFSYETDDEDSAYMIYFHKDGTTNVFDASDNNLTPEVI